MGQYDGDPAWPSCSRRLARRGENIEAAVGHGGEKVLIVDAIRTHRTHGLPSGCQEGATRSLRRRSNGSDSRLFDRGVAQGSQSSIPRRRSSAGSAAFPDFPEIPSMPRRRRYETSVDGGGFRTAGAAGVAQDWRPVGGFHRSSFLPVGCSGVRSRRLFPGGMCPRSAFWKRCVRNASVAEALPGAAGRRTQVLRGRRDNPWSGEEWT